MRHAAGGGDPGAPAEAHHDPDEARPERDGGLWPALSVLLFVGEVRERAERCLAAVLSQQAVGRLEVVLLDRASGLPPLRGSDHPAVRVLPLLADTTFSTARTIGVRAARAPVVAFLEEHSRPRAGWAEAVLAACADGAAAVGCEVHSGNRGMGLADIVGLITYGRFYPPLQRGESAVLTGNNASYRRAVLLAYEGELETLLLSDFLAGMRLKRDGHRVVLEPAAKIDHFNVTRLDAALAAFFFYQRCYAVARARLFRWPWMRRLAYIVLAPLVPFYFAARFGAFLLRARPRDLPLFLRNLPLVLILQASGALGQALGLLLGPGTAETAYTRHELCEHRPALSAARTP